MRRAIGLATAAGVAAVLGLGAWLRTTSLAALPVPDGDEAWFALMSARMARGLPFALETPTGNPMWLLQAPVQVPLIWAFGPQLWILRAASASAGLGAVALCAWRLGRVLDRTTAMIAAACLASLPAAIAASRTGWDVSLLPFFGVLMLSCAFRVRAGGLLLMLGLGYLAHPTAVFALPASLAVFASRWRHAEDGQPPRPWRGLAIRVGAIAAAGAALAVRTSLRPGAKAVLATYGIGLDGPHDPIRFANLAARSFLAIGHEVMPGRELAFGLFLLAVGPAGLVVLARRRQWDRLAVVVGTLASAAGLFAASGSEVLQPGMVRNGNFLLVPLAVSLACLLGALLPRGGAARFAGVASLTALAMATMLGVALGRLDDSKCQDGRQGTSPSDESPWTFRADVADPRVRALGDLLEHPAEDRPITVVCDHWNTVWTISYLCLDRQDVRVLDAAELRTPAAAVLRAGGLVVSLPGGRAGRAVRSVLPDSALRRDDVTVDGNVLLTSYRRAPAMPATRPAPADYDGDGRTDPATYDPDSGRWTIPGPPGHDEDVLLGPEDAIPAAGDYDGDGRDEAVAYRPDSGEWWTFGPDGPAPMAGRVVPAGIPIPGDYDGDGRDEPAVFDPVRAAFLLADLSRDLVFGQGAEYGGDPVPAPADYDGDGRTDVAVYQADAGTWILLRSAAGALAVPTGLPGGLPTPGDLDGDGRADLIVFRPDPGSWEVVRDPTAAPRPLDAPAIGLAAPGDYDGDGRFDLATLDPRSGRWSVAPSSGGQLARSPGPVSERR